jgi:hypothetical protein
MACLANPYSSVRNWTLCTCPIAFHRRRSPGSHGTSPVLLVNSPSSIYARQDFRNRIGLCTREEGCGATSELRRHGVRPRIAEWASAGVGLSRVCGPSAMPRRLAHRARVSCRGRDHRARRRARAPTGRRPTTRRLGPPGGRASDECARARYLLVGHRSSRWVQILADGVLVQPSPLGVAGAVEEVEDGTITCWVSRSSPEGRCPASSRLRTSAPGGAGLT